MSAFLKKELLQEPSPRSAIFRYGFLALILALVADDLYHPGSHYLRGLIIPAMLLLNHLAFQFRWPRAITISLRVIALAWVIVGSYFIFTR